MSQKTELKIISSKDVEVREIKWLWPPFIPRGKVTILQGDPGEGKTGYKAAGSKSVYRRNACSRNGGTGRRLRGHSGKEWHTQIDCTKCEKGAWDRIDQDAEPMVLEAP